MNDWEQYLSELIGARVQATPDASAVARLSIGMSSLYDIHAGQLLDQATHFIVPRNPVGPALTDILRHYPVLRKFLEGEVIFVLRSANPYEVKRLIVERIPFVVPGRQLFLPRNVVFVQAPESSGTGLVDAESPLSPRAQALVLYHLQKQSLAGRTQVEMAVSLHYTPMTVSRTVQELQHKRLCRVVTAGRANMLSVACGSDFWKIAENRLTSPVRARRFARFQNANARAKFYEAGITALSRYTMINEDPVPVLAIHDRAFSRLLSEGSFSVSPYRDEDCVQVELWRYDPALLAENKKVDRLSLYLSLRGHPDERIEGALHELLEGIPWQT
jgi:hypothetical protein